jgi:AAA15 family ATPase/GTPase
MITQLQVRNWKSFGEATLYIDPLTILIGTNSSGKSNLLEAFVFLSLTARGVDLNSIFRNGSAYGSLRGTSETLLNQSCDDNWFGLIVLFEHGEQKTKYRYEIQCEVSDSLPIKLKSESLEQGVEIDGETTYQYLFRTTERYNGHLDIEHAHEGELGSTTFLDLALNRSSLSRLAGSNLDREVLEGAVRTITALSNVSLIDPSPRSMRAYSAVGNTILTDCSNVAGVLAKLPAEEVVKTHAILTKYIDLLSEKDITKVYAQTVAPLNKDAMLYIEELWPGRKPTTIDAESASDGTLHLIGVMVAILTAKPETLVIIEEVDKGLHPSRADLLVRFLKEMALNRKIDILCTTHNPALLDAFGNEMISNMSIVYRNDQSGLSSVKLVEDIKHFGRLLSKGRVGKLSTMGLLEKAAG